MKNKIKKSSSFTNSKTPPQVCPYSGGACDQSFSGVSCSRAVFLYPSELSSISNTIETAVSKLRLKHSNMTWKTWKDFEVSGRIVFCEICKNIRFADIVFADVTSLNFNLLFEIGFAIAIGKPVVPVRDTSFQRDTDRFKKIGVLDTLGYLDFRNSDDLVRGVDENLGVKHAINTAIKPDFNHPLYYVKSPFDTDASVQMLSTIMRASIKFKTFDQAETARLSLHEAYKNVSSAISIVCHLVDKDRRDADIHNARAAFVSGLAVGFGRSVRMIQEGDFDQPLDYRDIVRPYSSPEQACRLLEKPLQDALVGLQARPATSRENKIGFLEALDLGDVSAENEIARLDAYFVKTSQYHEARKGNARLVIGRKGSGKTAVFYALRKNFSGPKSNLVLDLKPEGHQFSLLKEHVLTQLSSGMKEHTLVGFWTYILLCEFAHRIVDQEYDYAERDSNRKRKFDKIASVYENYRVDVSGDFSARLLLEVERISTSFSSDEKRETSEKLTEILFRSEIKSLEGVVIPYLAERETVLLLVDNLDKSWSVRGATREDILIIKTLLTAARKIQRDFERHNVKFICLVFLRNDIYEHLVLDTSDKGKDTSVLLDYEDREVFEKILLQRVKSQDDKALDFSSVWGNLADSHVGVRHSFDYLLDRTFMRPRDMLNFLHRSIEVAINRGHRKIKADDIKKAEETYSEDMLLSLAFEIQDVRESYMEINPLYAFLGSAISMDREDCVLRLMDSGFDENEAKEIIKMLSWFGFLGVSDAQNAEYYAYQMRHNLDKLMAISRAEGARLVIHPAFRCALKCKLEKPS